MIDEICSLLVNNQYVDVIKLSSQILKNNRDLDYDYLNLFETLSICDLENTIQLLKELIVKHPEIEALQLILSNIEENQQLIRDKYRFFLQLDENKPKFNLIVNNNILIGETSKENTLTSLDDLFHLALPENDAYIQGEFVHFKALSDIDTLESLISNSENLKIKNQEKHFDYIFNFLNSLNENFQQKLSERKIGLYIHKDQLYLIKFIPMAFIPENKGTVQLINTQDAGKIIGINILSNNSIGNLVEFTQGDSEDNFLIPLFSLDSSLFFTNTNSNFDLNTEKGINLFLESFEDRINTGISLLSGNFKVDIKDMESLIKYTELELQKIEKEKNLGNRIHRLVDLLKLNERNISLRTRIFSVLEDSYIMYIDSLYHTKDIMEIIRSLEKFKELKLFSSEDKIHKLVLINSSHLKRTLIDGHGKLEIINSLDRNFTMTNQYYMFLKDAYYNALSEVVRPLILGKKFHEIEQKMNKNFSKIENDSFINILKSLVLNLVPPTGVPNIPMDDFLSIIEFIFSYFKEMSFDPKSIPKFQSDLEATFLSLSKKPSFIKFMKNKLVDFLICLIKLEVFIFSPSILIEISKNINIHIVQSRYEIFSNLDIDEVSKIHIDLLDFYKKNNLFPLAVDFFENLLKNYDEVDFLTIDVQGIDFFSRMIHYLSRQPKKITSLESIKQKSELLLSNWYLHNRFPLHSFSEQREILNILSKIISDSSGYAKMKKNIDIRELLNFVNETTEIEKITTKTNQFIEQHLVNSIEFYDEFLNILKTYIDKDLSYFFDWVLARILLECTLRQSKESNIAPQKLDELIELFYNRYRDCLIFLIETNNANNLEACFDNIGGLNSMHTSQLFSELMVHCSTAEIKSLKEFKKRLDVIEKIKLKIDKTSRSNEKSQLIISNKKLMNKQQLQSIKKEYNDLICKMADIFYEFVYLDREDTLFLMDKEKEMQRILLFISEYLSIIATTPKAKKKSSKISKKNEQTSEINKFRERVGMIMDNRTISLKNKYTFFKIYKETMNKIKFQDQESKKLIDSYFEELEYYHSIPELLKKAQALDSLNIIKEFLMKKYEEGSADLLTHHYLGIILTFQNDLEKASEVLWNCLNLNESIEIQIKALKNLYKILQKQNDAPKIEKLKNLLPKTIHSKIIDR